MVGKTLGHYEILEPLGAGGMGEVYRARDTKLKRDVAIKVLPESLSKDGDRLARLEREAHLLAALNHPGIATIYSLDEADGTRFLALELIQGQSLEDRLRSGPMPVGEAVDTCAQIAEALEAAHGEGIVHRDLKPANVLVTIDGRVKVLDFGLAKTIGKVADTEVSQSPTETVAATRAGTILGTAPYMSPEQVRGKPVDKRADNWAFGCVLYETLTGTRAFGRETVADTLAAIIESEPDWERLPSETPPAVRALLRRCLRTDLKLRQRDMGDAWIQLGEATGSRGAHTPSAAGVPMEASGPRGGGGVSPAVPWIVAVIASLVAAYALLGRVEGDNPERVIRAVLPFAQEEAYVLTPTGAPPRIAVSSDGSTIVYHAGQSRGDQIQVRRLDEASSTPIRGTEGGVNPFLSPDGRWLGFISGGALRKVPISGGASEPLAETPAAGGAAWAVDDWIYYSRGPNSGISKVHADGGDADVVTVPDAAAGEAGHYWPHVLPDGAGIVFTIEMAGRPMDEARVALLPAGEQAWITLVEGGSDGRYVETGHLVYATSAGLHAIPLDPGAPAASGVPIDLDVEVAADLMFGSAPFAASAEGTLSYLPVPVLTRETSVAIVERSGELSVLDLPARHYLNPRLSPDQSRFVLESRAVDDHLWLYDVGRGTLQRLTLEGENLSPVWTPDGGRITLGYQNTGPVQLASIPPTGGESPTLLDESEDFRFPTSWSPDGAFLLFHQPSTEALDIGVFARGADPAVSSWLATPFTEAQAVFSPDGNWVAYTSNASGRAEVYVRGFDTPASDIRQVSIDGGTEPMWEPGGDELFYRNDEQMMVVDVTYDEVTFEQSTPRELFRGAFEDGDFGANYDVFPDGRFIMIVESEPVPGPREIRLVLNWFRELEDLVGGGR